MVVSHRETSQVSPRVRALVTNTERNQQDIKSLQRELIDIGELLKELMFEVKRMQDRSLSQRESDELRMKIFRLQVEVLLGKQLSDLENDRSLGSAKPEELPGELPSPDKSGNEPEG